MGIQEIVLNVVAIVVAVILVYVVSTKSIHSEVERRPKSKYRIRKSSHGFFVVESRLANCFGWKYIGSRYFSDDAEKLLHQQVERDAADQEYTYQYYDAAGNKIDKVKE